MPTKRKKKLPLTKEIRAKKGTYNYIRVILFYVTDDDVWSIYCL